MVAAQGEPINDNIVRLLLQNGAKKELRDYKGQKLQFEHDTSTQSPTGAAAASTASATATASTSPVSGAGPAESRSTRTIDSVLGQDRFRRLAG